MSCKLCNSSASVKADCTDLNRSEELSSIVFPDTIGDRGTTYAEAFKLQDVKEGVQIWDRSRIHFLAVTNVLDFAASGKGVLGQAQLDLTAQKQDTPIVIFSHLPLYDLYPQWGWATADSAQLLSLLSRFAAGKTASSQLYIQKFRFSQNLSNDGISGFNLASLDRVKAWHTIIEAERLAFADRARFIGDPSYVEVPLTGLLSPEFAKVRRQSIGERVPWGLDLTRWTLACRLQTRSRLLGFLNAMAALRRLMAGLKRRI